MKALYLNPIDYDITVWQGSRTHNCSEVYLKVGTGPTANGWVCAEDTRKIGEWFIRLSKELEKKK